MILLANDVCIKMAYVSILTEISNVTPVAKYLSHVDDAAICHLYGYWLK